MARSTWPAALAEVLGLPPWLPGVVLALDENDVAPLREARRLHGATVDDDPVVASRLDLLWLQAFGKASQSKDERGYRSKAQAQRMLLALRFGNDVVPPTKRRGRRPDPPDPSVISLMLKIGKQVHSSRGEATSRKCRTSKEYDAVLKTYLLPIGAIWNRDPFRGCFVDVVFEELARRLSSKRKGVECAGVTERTAWNRYKRALMLQGKTEHNSSASGRRFSPAISRR